MRDGHFISALREKSGERGIAVTESRDLSSSRNLLSKMVVRASAGHVEDLEVVDLVQQRNARIVLVLQCHNMIRAFPKTKVQLP